MSQAKWTAVLLTIGFLGLGASFGADVPEDRLFKIWIGPGLAPMSGGAGVFIVYFDGKDTYTPSATAELSSSVEVPLGFVYSTPRFDVTGELALQFEDVDRIGFEVGIAFPVVRRGKNSLHLGVAAGLAALEWNIAEVPIGPDTGAPVLWTPADDGEIYEVEAGSHFRVERETFGGSAFAAYRALVHESWFFVASAGYRYYTDMDDPDLYATRSDGTGSKIPWNFENEFGQYSRSVTGWSVETNGLFVRFGVGYMWGRAVSLPSPGSED